MKFDHLLPRTLFESLQDQGYTCTGQVTPLNSYENRVYELGIESEDFVIAKFYRPQRWSLKQIAEEHQFVKKLSDLEIPVLQALSLKSHCAISPFVSEKDGIYYSLYPKFRGRELSEIQGDDLKQLGRLLGRLHNLGEDFEFQERIEINENQFGYEALDFILNSPLPPVDLKTNIEQTCLQAIELTSQFLDLDFPWISVHGDCHIANILWKQEHPHLIDFDDCLSAPAVQDLWMLFYGNKDEQNLQKEVFFEGYETFRPFDHNSFVLTEALRTLRMLKHQAWIGQRYEENIFQTAFPYYTDYKHWQEFLLNMKEQIAAMQETLHS